MNVADQHTVQCKGSPQASLIARVYPELANHLRTALEGGMAARSPAESAGLLLGTTDGGVVSLRAFRPFATWDQRQNNSPKDEQVDEPGGKLSASLSIEPDLGDSELVGWCYMRQAGSVGLLERDVEFHDRHFGRATDLMLILNAREARDVSVEVFAPSLNVPLSP
jgi:hypothetical protein